MKRVSLKISFEDLFGKKNGEMMEFLRRDRWERWKKLAGEHAEGWEPDGCAGCRCLDGDWCKLMHLPGSVNPVLSFRSGVPSMACMGGGYDDGTTDDGIGVE